MNVNELLMRDLERKMTFLVNWQAISVIDRYTGLKLSSAEIALLEYRSITSAFNFRIGLTMLKLAAPLVIFPNVTVCNFCIDPTIEKKVA